MSGGSLSLEDPKSDRSDARINVYSHEGVWYEEISQENRIVTEIRPMPFNLVRTYADQAARLGIVKELDDGTWYATIPDFEGVWADGDFPSDALDDLADVVYDWAILKMLDKDIDIPVVGGIDLRTT